MDAFNIYAGLLNASAMVLLLMIIVAFYINLTVEAFRHAKDDRDEMTVFGRGPADLDLGPRAMLKPVVVPVRYRRVS